MNRAEWNQWIFEQFDVEAEYPWIKYPTYAVYRHRGNRKWFAVIMELPTEKLGLAEGGRVDAVNLKCDPLLIGGLLQEEGIHRGYHMNKDYWITVRLDGSVAAERIKGLLELSFDLTKSGTKR